jgi:hypothetical protein
MQIIIRKSVEFLIGKDKKKRFFLVIIKNKGN